MIEIILAVLTIWAIPWKIYAVWNAVKHGQKKWFVVLLLLNTFAILELIYIFKIAGKSWADVKHDFRSAWQSLKSK